MVIKFQQALIWRRTNNLSLLDSYFRAIEYAGINLVPSSKFSYLQYLTRDFINFLERDSERRKKLGKELQYHNCQHFADAVFSMGFFLGYTKEFTDYEKQLLLLVMLAHDFGHRGLGKKLANLSHEEESIALLRQSNLQQLPTKDLSMIEVCILGTQPDQVEIVAQDYRSNPHNPSAYMRALVNDADIAASFIDPLGAELSAMILQEKGILAPTEVEVCEALNAFRNRAHIITPVARKLLGLELVN